MKKIILYGHGGSYNHGCEAIVRSTVKILKDVYEDVEIIVYSNNPQSDYKWGVNEIVNNIQKMPEPSYMSRLIRKIKSLLKINSNDINNSVAKKFTRSLKNVDLAISIGGDNYCYTKEFNSLFYRINELLHKKGIKTIFWGCSISEEFIDEEMIKDLNRYNLITVRETITQQNLNKHGINSNVKLIPDTAFELEVKMPQEEIKLNNCIGINLSPMIMEYEKNQDIALKNYKKLIEYILNNTKYNVLLIPHVINNSGGDIKSNELLYNEFKQYKDRIIMVPEMKAEEIKSVISKCDIFVGARTHATIAAYSTCVPTLVVGYSVKARGIATDLFGRSEDYVIPVQSLVKEDDLEKAFKWIEERKDEIKEDLQKKIPTYKEDIKKLRKIISNI